MEEKILTAEQVAQSLQVHPFTVLKFIKQGKLRASKLGRVYRIRESDVIRFLDEQEAEATKPKKEQVEPHVEKENENPPETKEKKKTVTQKKTENQNKQKKESVPPLTISKKEPQPAKPHHENEFDHYILG